MTRSQKTALLTAIIGGSCVVIATCLGLVGSPLIGWYIDTLRDQQVQASQTISPPIDAVELPAGQSDVFSVVINPGIVLNAWGGLVTKELDRTMPSQSISQEDVILSGSPSALSAIINRPSTIEVIVTGKGSGEPVQISNRIPIRLENYEPIPKEIDMLSSKGGGGGDFWFLGTDISKQALSFPDKISWASYTTDLELRLKLAERECPPCIEDYPSEIQRVLSEGLEPLPDYFLLQDNEKIAFSVAMFFKDPGIYRLSVGVEYIYGRYKGITWAEPYIEVYVPENYFVWTCDKIGNPIASECRISLSCQLDNESEYICTNQ